MKILMLSIFAPHFFNWTEQLKESGHEVYWLDIFDSATKVPQLDFAHQITGWRYRWDYPGRYFLKKKAPAITHAINLFNERDLKKFLDDTIKEIKPDVVHSFVMYLATAPVREVIQKHPDIKWVFSSWGSDLFYYRKSEKKLEEMRQTLPELDYMFSDCHRDYKIAVENGFSGEFLGVFPGGGGFDFSSTDQLMLPLGSRKIILVKGYQGLHGRCIPVLKALWEIREKLEDLKLIVFGAAHEVFNFVATSPLKNWGNLEVFGNLNHSHVMKLMGEAQIYIGNSLSDGMPNTLFEAMTMGAFPIQSNPGEATAEIIIDGKNGLLISSPEDEEEIARLVTKVLFDKKMIPEGVQYNLREIKPNLEREFIKAKVLGKYHYIEQNLHNIN